MGFPQPANEHTPVTAASHRRAKWDFENERDCVVPLFKILHCFHILYQGLQGLAGPPTPFDSLPVTAPGSRCSSHQCLSSFGSGCSCWLVSFLHHLMCWLFLIRLGFCLDTTCWQKAQYSVGSIWVHTPNLPSLQVLPCALPLLSSFWPSQEQHCCSSHALVLGVWLIENNLISL